MNIGIKIKLFGICLAMLIFGQLGFSENQDYRNIMLNQRIGVISGVKRTYENPEVIIIYADVISADEFLRQIAKIETDRKMQGLNLIFPDVDYLNDYIEEVAKKVNYINIVLFNVPNNHNYMKNRDYLTYQEKLVDKKIEKLSNVKVYKVNVPEREVEEIFLESLTKIVNDSSYFKKYIMNLK